MTDEPVSSLCFLNPNATKFCLIVKACKRKKIDAEYAQNWVSVNQEQEMAATPYRRSGNCVISCGSSSVWCSNRVSVLSGCLPLSSAALSFSPGILTAYVFMLSFHWIISFPWQGDDVKERPIQSRAWTLQIVWTQAGSHHPALPPPPAPWCGSRRLHWHRHRRQVCALCIYVRCTFALSLLTEVAFPSVWKVQDRNGRQRSKGLGETHYQSLPILVSDLCLLVTSRAIDFPYCNAAKQRDKLLSKDGKRT